MSGPKTSYYEEYMRKRDSDRSLPPTSHVLTDRNSYVNFLEVQLERVSAACLGVQAYDGRFNDMQALLVSMEHRVTQATRLVALAQKCTEVCIRVARVAGDPRFFIEYVVYHYLIDYITTYT
jgi:hypothetical protein